MRVVRDDQRFARRSDTHKTIAANPAIASIVEMSVLWELNGDAGRASGGIPAQALPPQRTRAREKAVFRHAHRRTATALTSIAADALPSITAIAQISVLWYDDALAIMRALHITAATLPSTSARIG